MWYMEWSSAAASLEYAAGSRRLRSRSTVAGLNVADVNGNSHSRRR